MRCTISWGFNVWDEIFRVDEGGGGDNQIKKFCLKKQLMKKG